MLVGISVGCLMGCFPAPPPWRKTAPLKRPLKASMGVSQGLHDSNPYPNRSRIARYNATKVFKGSGTSLHAEMYSRSGHPQPILKLLSRHVFTNDRCRHPQVLPQRYKEPYTPARNYCDINSENILSSN